MVARWRYLYWQLDKRDRIQHLAIRWTVCLVRGHDPITKFDGTVLCRRC